MYMYVCIYVCLSKKKLFLLMVAKLASLANNFTL